MLYRKAFFGIIALAPTISASIIPPRVSFNDLLVQTEESDSLANTEKFFKSLKEYGFCSLTDVFPLGEKKSMFQKLKTCILSSEGKDAVGLHVFNDGTQRKTLATHAVYDAPSSRFHPPIIPGVPKSKSCQEFEISSQSFRQGVDQVSQVVALQLDAENSRGSGSVILSDEYTSMQDVVFHGDHLEHFHSYEKSTETDASVTMDWHKDQGLFLLFTPGQLTSQGGTASQDFHVKVKGKEHLVHFDESDDLVVLLGDGVGQLGIDLEAPWHSVSIKSGTKDRVWYGRMVLPPADLVHPASGLLYGEIRQLLNQNKAGDIGCSSQSIAARHLQETECNVAGELLCWHQCMPTNDFGVNETSCAALDLDLACINPQNELWDNKHANKEAGYAPGCIDVATAVVANQDTQSNAITETTTWLASVFSMVVWWLIV